MGKIRLGVRVKKRAPDKRCQHDAQGMCNYCTYPRETPHFVVPDAVQKIYGAEPASLDILLPVDDVETVFPQAYEFYGSGRGLKCSGNGLKAMRSLAFDKELRREKLDGNEGTELIEVECTCPLYEEDRGCTQRGHLSVILPKVSVGAVYQIDTGSYNSIVDLNSSLDYVRALVGRIAMVPLVLKREPRETHYEGKKAIHYTMRVELEGDIAFLNALRENTQRVLTGPTFRLPAPLAENPVVADLVVAEEGEVLEAKVEPVTNATAPQTAPTTPPISAGASSPAVAVATTSKPETATLKEAQTTLLKFTDPKACADYFNKLRPGQQQMLRNQFKEHVQSLNKVTSH
jgi:hypothetical protein